MVCKAEERRKETEWGENLLSMTGFELKEMERVIPIAPWTSLVLSGDEHR